ncbi:hypothetical protein PISMIDRAFT_681160 [Pisolithus microcarpus 441]|uniref:Uncharacterized protein n=1 Tax=Pisolithus microcarpus 441 TaxID=765257 RepID=A0A0C9ZP02_9AGAM|nr:hypothetical protein PISMIDRAFT_681160 [Pisolithus microcarpus 441]
MPSDSSVLEILLQSASSRWRLYHGSLDQQNFPFTFRDAATATASMALHVFSAITSSCRHRKWDTVLDLE